MIRITLPNIVNPAIIDEWCRDNLGYLPDYDPIDDTSAVYELASDDDAVLFLLRWPDTSRSRQCLQ